MYKKNKINLLIFGTTFWPLKGGAQRVAFDLFLEGIKRDELKTYLFLPIYSKKIIPPRMLKNTYFHTRKYTPLYNGTVKLLKLIWIILNNDINIIQTHIIEPDALLAYIASKILFFKKIVIFNTSHGQDIRSRDFVNKKFFEISLGAFLIRKISNSINMILPSHYLADLGLKKGFFTKYSIIRNPCEEFNSDINRETDDIREKGKKIKMISLSGMRELKRINKMIDLADELNRKSMLDKYYICGDGELRKSYEKYAQSLGLFNCVEFCGFVEGERKQNLLKKCDFFLLLSSIENYPVSTLEAMSFGTVVIASNVGGLKEQITSGINGILVDEIKIPSIASNLINIFHNKEKMSLLVDKGRITAKNHSLKNIFDDYLNIYRESLKKK